MTKNKNKTQAVIKISPDIDVDWFNVEAVKKYYDSFDTWSFYIDGACKYVEACVEIKDGLALFEQRYFLLAPYASPQDWCGKSKELPADGWYYVRLYKRGYGYYNTMPTTNYAYVYTLSNNRAPFTKEQVYDFNYRNTYQFKSGSCQEDLDHIKSLDLSTINAKELDFIKYNTYQLFKHLLPFKAKNNVWINKWESFNNPLITNKGLIYVDNGYNGHQINKMDYSVTLSFHPSFSNESQYYKTCCIKGFTAKAFEDIAAKVEESIKLYAQI